MQSTQDPQKQMSMQSSELCNDIPGKRQTVHGQSLRHARSSSWAFQNSESLGRL